MAKSTKAKKATKKKANNTDPYRKKLVEHQEQALLLELPDPVLLCHQPQLAQPLLASQWVLCQHNRWCCRQRWCRQDKSQHTRVLRDPRTWPSYIPCILYKHLLKFV